MSDEPTNFPFFYALTVGKMNFKNEEPIEKTYMFEITKEGDQLIASCSELHLIISADNMESLQNKIQEVYMDNVEDDDFG